MENEIQIQLNFRSKKPLSEQLQEAMHRLFQAGALPPGAQLPTVRKLAAQLQVNFNTVARVYRILDQEGMISTQQGRGTYVVDPSEAMPAEEFQDDDERGEALVNEMLEKAARMHIPQRILQEALDQRIRQENDGMQIIPRKKIHTIQKKRMVTPTWYREVLGVREKTGIKKGRKGR